MRDASKPSTGVPISGYETKKMFLEPVWEHVQGILLLDVVFGFGWSVVLKKLETFLIEINAVQPMPVHDKLPLFGHSFITEHHSYFLGPTWMDDLAVCLVTPEAERLPSIMGQATSFLLDLCDYHCMSPNLFPGKTELLMSFRGRGSRHQKTHHFSPHASGFCLSLVNARSTMCV